ncbi:hypothetical protein [Flavobacterium ajazii]|uniref:hypothetical protein n=1 Tax=Flavobacterium ajazii TaxID=2692318 RepID=UPI0013D5C555|nr:hypothetical protein [Flavobacterium ajazii]
MKFKNTFLTLSFLLTSVVSFSQQIGSGYAPAAINDFNKELLSGFYQGYNAAGQVDNGGWNHLLNLRHSDPTNNHQLQIVSSYLENDKLFFRKFARGLGANNPVWYEIATRGDNYFIGTQVINGGLTFHGSEYRIGWSNFSYGSYIDVNNSQNALRIRNKNNVIMFEVNGSNNFFTGNVGIGTTAPSAKLEVAGLIKSFVNTHLGTDLHNFQLLNEIGGRVGDNMILNRLWSLRDVNSTYDWYSGRLHDGISIDASFGTPHVDTKTWWERDPNDNIQSWVMPEKHI